MLTLAAGSKPDTTIASAAGRAADRSAHRHTSIKVLVDAGITTAALLVRVTRD